LQTFYRLTTTLVEKLAIETFNKVVRLEEAEEERAEADRALKEALNRLDLFLATDS